MGSCSSLHFYITYEDYGGYTKNILNTNYTKDDKIYAFLVSDKLQKICIKIIQKV